MIANKTSPLPKYQEAEEEALKNNEEFLSSLPKEKGWIFNHLYNYRGYWHAASHLQGTIAFQNHFQAKDSDIVLVTTPKSGTTWLKAIVFAISNRLHYGVRSSHHPLLFHNPHELVPFIDFKIYLVNKKPDLSCFKEPRLFATHLPYVSLPQSVKASPCKIVYLCRNPKDTFVSLWHFCNSLKTQAMGGQNSMEEMFELFCKGISGYGPYWDHVMEYWKKSLEMPEKIFFLKFEDLKEKPSLHLKKLAEFLGCPFSPEEEASGVPDGILRLCSFESLSNLDVNRNDKLPSEVENKAFFRRGEVGDWKSFLSDEMINRLDTLAIEK